MEISLLDLGIYKTNGGSMDKVSQLFEIAPILEKLKYKRFWLGEHHERDIAWRSPEILISLLLGYTETIRIGSAGNLLKLHNPLRLVHNYALMESIFSDRVDMGLAGGTASKRDLSALIGSTSFNHSFDEKAEKLFYYFNQEYEKSEKIQFPPYVSGLKPNIWLLSTGNSKTKMAIENKANYVWSLFHKLREDWPDLDSIVRFENEYFNVHNELPDTAIAISGICINDKKRTNVLKKQFKNNVHVNLIGSLDECTFKMDSILKRFKGVREVVFADLSLNLEEKIESCHNFKNIIAELNL